MQARNLKVEYLTNPIGIDCTCPRLSWTCVGGVLQKAYRIIARDENNTILWDSGKVISNQMHLIKWEGQPLSSRSIVYWNVDLWDESGKCEEGKETSYFELGLLNKDDWKASWISGDYKVNKKQRYPVDCFRKTITIQNKKIKKARA